MKKHNIMLMSVILIIAIFDFCSAFEYGSSLPANYCSLKDPNLDERDTLLSEQIQRSVSKLSADTPFIIFDLMLSEDEVDCFKKLKIGSSICYNNYGDLVNLECGTKSFLQSLDNENEISELAARVITKMVIQSLIGCGQESAWVTLRASTNTDAHVDADKFDIPRWHRDGIFYSSSNLKYKIVTALKGAQTLLYPQDSFNNLSSTMQERFRLLSEGEETKDSREARAKMLDMSKVISAKPHCATIFVVGADNAALHSEPPIREDRLFLSILPGSNEQILEWALKNK